ARRADPGPAVRQAGAAEAVAPPEPARRRPQRGWTVAARARDGRVHALRHRYRRQARHRGAGEGGGRAGRRQGSQGVAEGRIYSGGSIVSITSVTAERTAIS